MLQVPALLASWDAPLPLAASLSLPLPVRHALLLPGAHVVAQLPRGRVPQHPFALVLQLPVAPVPQLLAWLALPLRVSLFLLPRDAPLLAVHVPRLRLGSSPALRVASSRQEPGSGDLRRWY